MNLTEIQNMFSLDPFDEMVMDAFQHGRYSDAYRLETRDIASDLPRHSPPNFLPLVGSDRGDVMGYYFPKGDRGKLFAAVQYLSSNMQLFPLKCDLSTVFLKPSVMEDAGNVENWNYFKGVPELSGLVISPNESVTELPDLLKPMSLNWRFLDGLDRESKGLLPTGQVFFRSHRDFYSADRWIELSEYLEAEGDVVGAMSALENALAVMWRYPFFGGYEDEDWEKRFMVNKAIWERIAACEGADGFDTALSQCMLRSFEKGATS